MHLNISSSAPPRLLIAFQDFYGNKLLLVSSPNPNVSSSSSSSCFVPYKDLSVFKINGKLVYNAVRGLGLISVSRLNLNVGICNPSTRQLHIFPQIKFQIGPTNSPRPNYFLGYDSIKDQYKVLAIDHWSMEHKILLLGRDEAWREAPCVTCPHVSHTLGLYMNGNLYYGASRTDITSPNNNSIIVRFNVRLETFNIINVPSKFLPMGYENMWLDDERWRIRTDKTLINYKGKIGVIENARQGLFRMWVVEDAEKEEWSMNTFHLPESAAGLDFNVMGTFYTGEICLVPREWSDPFCLFYYNLEKKSMRSVIIEGLPVLKLKRAHQLFVTILDHYESFMFLGT